MTRRERLEAKLTKREEWAGKASHRAEVRQNAAHRAVDGIPFGQPILVGHHSEKRHRAALDRCDNNMRKACEESDLASHHASKADGVERQLEHSVFSDDTDAVEQLRARIAENSAKRDDMAAQNRFYRKHKSMIGYPGMADAIARALDADIPQRYSWEQKGPARPYELTNLGARIRADEQRVKDVMARQARTASAESNGGVLIEGTGDWVRVTFAEKPDRDVLDALRAARFQWGAGSWCGPRASLPSSLVTA